MEVLEKTSNKLVCETNPISSFLVAISFYGAVFLSPTYLVLNFSGVQELACKRIEPAQVDCKLSQSRFMGLVNEGVISLSDVKKIRVDTTTHTTTDDEGNTSTSESYEVILLYSNNEISLSNDFIQDTSKINAFIENNKSTDLNIQYDTRFDILRLLGTIIFVVILLCFLKILIHKTTVYIFDKNIGKLTIEERRLVGKKVRKVIEYPLLEIVDVFVETKTDDEGDFRGYNVRLSLTENNGHNLFIPFPLKGNTSEKFFVKIDAQQFANTVEQFLNLQKESSPLAFYWKLYLAIQGSQQMSAEKFNLWFIAFSLLMRYNHLYSASVSALKRYLT